MTGTPAETTATNGPAQRRPEHLGKPLGKSGAGPIVRALSWLSRVRYTLLSFATVAVMIVIWWVVGASGRVDPMLLPTIPSIGSEQDA
ncbi:MAG: hypothetical protein ACK5JM_10170 [Rhodoblastus sp.]